MYRASRLIIGTLLFVVSTAPAAMAGYIGFGTMGRPASDGFTVFSTPTKWDPGFNSASVFTATKKGPKSSGAASWSIMGAGHSDASGFDPTAHGANLTDSITALNVPGFALSDYEVMIDDALNVWAAASGFTNLGQVADGGVDAGAFQAAGGHLGDIRVAAWEFVNPIALAHAFQPGTEAIFGAGGTIAGDAHFDVNTIWADDPIDTIADADIDLLTVLIHEFGHALGLGHSGVPGSVMEPVYAGARRVLMSDDMQGIKYLYGPNKTKKEGGDGGGGGGKPPWADGPGGPPIVNGLHLASAGTVSIGIPEPSSLVLASFGLVCLLCWRRKKSELS